MSERTLLTARADIADSPFRRYTLLRYINTAKTVSDINRRETDRVSDEEIEEQLIV